MDFSSLYFESTLKNLTYSDVKNFFSEPKEESLRLEFKSFNPKSNLDQVFSAIPKVICAFLNSEGGILIWGAPVETEKTGKKVKTCQGELTNVIGLKGKDWLVNKISDLITPLPVGINVAILEEDDNTVCIFEVQQSNYSPHQSNDTYWARLDGQTKPAPHYLIDALFKKIKYPDIEGFIRLDEIAAVGEEWHLSMRIMIFNFSQLINEENLSFRVTCNQGKFIRPEGSLFRLKANEVYWENFATVLHYGNQHETKIKLRINRDQLCSKHGNKVFIVLMFGGKKSPYKNSYYHLDIEKYNSADTKFPDYLIFEREENVLSLERDKVIGSTKESIIRRALMR